MSDGEALLKDWQDVGGDFSEAVRQFNLRNELIAERKSAYESAVANNAALARERGDSAHANAVPAGNRPSSNGQRIGDSVSR